MKITEPMLGLADVSYANGRRIPDAARAAEEFEAFLVAEIWKQSQRGPKLSKLLGDGSAQRMTNEMWIEELVGRAVASRGVGLAATLERGAEPAREDGA